MLLLTTLVAAGLTRLVFLQRAEWSLSSVQRSAVDWFANERDPTLVLPPGCVGDADVVALDVAGERALQYRSCAGGADQAPRSLFVLGDSHAAAYAPLVHRLSVQHSMAATVVQMPGCPLLGMAGPMTEQAPAPGCSQRWQRVLGGLQPGMRPGDVVLLSSLRLPRFSDQWILYDNEEVIQRHLGAAAAKQRELAVQDAGRWLQPLLKQGLHVVLEDPKPIFRAVPFRCADPWTQRNPACARGLVENLSDEEVFRAPVRQAWREVVAQQGVSAQQLSIFDPLPALCEPTVCRAIQTDGRPLFFDADHLSRWGNERVYPAFVEHLQHIGVLAPVAGSVRR